MSIPSHILEQLNGQADLISIIGRHTTLKRAGREYKGCCPFHGEKSPSFYVNPQKNIYHCFGCGVGGNAISFLRDYENLTFIEAVKELSQQTGIEVPEDERRDVSYQRSQPIAPTSAPSAPTPKSVAKSAPKPAPSQQIPPASVPPSAPLNDNDHRYDDAGHNMALDVPYIDTPYADDSHDYYASTMEAPPWSDDDHNASHAASHALATPDQKLEGNLYNLLVQVWQFYRRNLATHPHAKHYFTSRGITDESIDTFGLGYAPFGWQHLEHEFPQDIEGLKVLGLVRVSESGRDYDLLRDRVIFPIRDAQGRVIGFAGRALDDEVKPKYINSSDSPVFHKQHVLYGYYESRQMRASDWLVVEGYMDVIALYQAGIYGAVASMGTAINDKQISKLLTLNPTLTLSFDGDSAGQKAAWRTLEVALPVMDDDKELRFLTLPGNHDPDTFIHANGADAMREQISNAMPLSQYIFAYLSEQHDLSLAEGKAKLMAQVRALGKLLPKGSSFRYLLNNDIYQKLGGKRSQNAAAKDALLDFDGGMSVSQQLQLCFLFQPRALMDDPIVSIWQQAGLDRLNLPAHIKQKAPSDMMRVIAWEDLQDEALFDVVSTIKRCLSCLPEDINMAAHFILSNLPPATQEPLGRSWGAFYKTLSDRHVLSLDGLITELVIQMLERHMIKRKQILIKNPDHIKQNILNRQTQQLSLWVRAQQAEQSAQM